MNEKTNGDVVTKEVLKKTVKEEKDEMDVIKKKHMQSLIRHIKLVQDAAQLLGERLIESGQLEFGKILIANALSHDQSKFHGIEWKHLIRCNDDDIMLKQALDQHLATNTHHPEYWGGINEMPNIYLAEMVCDIYARSSEMGTDLRDWVKNIAVDKYKMSPQGKAYKALKRFIDMLLDEPFAKIELLK